MPTPPSLSRQTSRTGRHHYRSTDPQHPARAQGRTASRPPCDKRDSSPLRTLATFGLLAGQAAVGAAAPLQRPQAAAGAELVRTRSRMQEDNQRAWDLARRDMGDPVAIDWEAVDYSHVDWSMVDFTGGPVTSEAPSRTASPHVTVSPTPVAIGAQAQAPLAAAGPTAAPAPPAVPSDAALFAEVEADQNAMAVVWRGDKPATIHAYANLGPYQPGMGAPYSVLTVQPFGHGVLTFPQGWSGRLQLMSGPEGRADDPALWVEVTFDGWQGLTFADLSCIRGTNAGASLRASDGTTQMAIPADIVARAPQSVKVQDASGAWVIRDTEGYDGALHDDVVAYLKTVTDTTQAYLQHADDLATHATYDPHLVVELFP